MAGRGYEKRWEVLGDILGEGGQGKVFKVVDNKLVSPMRTILFELKGAIRGLSALTTSEESESGNLLLLKQALERLQIRERNPHFGALKILHAVADARDPTRADERLKQEIDAMQSLRHNNLVEILDANASEQWYVSRYYSGGTLIDKLGRFNGDLPHALLAFRNLVAGVAEIHKAGMVHRDIKPHNIFLADDGSLVLGDFGLVFFQDAAHTRISNTLENVGSSDWMPAWAMRMRIDAITPNFDVFSLGKVLWSMLSGKTILRLWYFDEEEFDLTKQFPNNSQMKLANDLFAKCIVEKPAQCLPSAIELLAEVDSLISQLDHAEVDLTNPNRRCNVCGAGHYEVRTDGSGDAATIIPTFGGFSSPGYTGIGDAKVELRNFGLEPEGNNSFRICVCSNCGHVQLFYRTFDEDAPAWRGGK